MRRPPLALMLLCPIGVVACAIGLTWLFWWPLWQGGGLIGGDLYPYYFPQKSFLADRLQAGEIPLWNPLVGFGYPLLGESQTGALYPPNLVLYRFLDVNTAYNVSQILHYVLACIATWAVARRLGLQRLSALLTAVSFVYGWFPPRICLEWAIIGGAWFATIVWGSVAFLQTEARRWLLLVGLCLGMDLLAGHYHLAFITLLCVAVLPLLVRVETSAAGESMQRRVGLLFGTLVCGFLLAAVQLVPTWELKTQSQRQAASDLFSPTYGHLPPTAVSQLVAPWMWHRNDISMDELLVTANFLSVPDATNKAEAHLYCGLLPFVLAIVGLLWGPWRRQLSVPRPWLWALLALLGLLLASGWPTYSLGFLPGLGFFRGPGRYGMLSAFAFALLAGASLDALARDRKWSPGTVRLIGVTLILVTVADLWALSREYRFGSPPFWSRQVFYATLIDDPPVRYRSEESWRDVVLEEHSVVRVFAPGPNVPTLLGVSALPVYLGLGPEIYETDLVRADFGETSPKLAQATLERLSQFGVTHLLLENSLDPTVWPVRSVGAVFDPLLNRAFARRDPYYLYEIPSAHGPVAFRSGSADSMVKSVAVSANRITIDVETASDDILVLLHLNYPGWGVIVDGRTMSPRDDEPLFRAVDVPPGAHRVEWIYNPRSIWIGAGLSLVGIVSLAGITLLTPRPAAQQRQASQ